MSIHRFPSVLKTAATVLLALMLFMGVSPHLTAQDATPIPVFTIVFEENATDNSGGASASSKVEVQLAPGSEWHGYFGTNTGTEDKTTPAKMYRLRGSLYGLKTGEPMCFGILKHKGSASAGGRTINGPPASDGDAWGLREDAARFKRTEDGGILSVMPITYQDEDPPEFALLSPGAYDYGTEGDERYHRLLEFKFTSDELKNLKRVRKANEATVTDQISMVTQRYKITVTGETQEEVEVTVEADEYDKWIPEGNLDKPGEKGNRLKIKFDAHKTGDPGMKRKVNLDVTLVDVSKEKGVCLNYPVDGGRVDQGLRILKKENDEEDWEVEEPNHAKTKEPVESVTLTVTAHDFGAYGKLQIVAKDESGNNMKVKVQNEEKSTLIIPKDENSNHIADEWELKWAGGLRGNESDDKDDQPEGKPGNDGDGLTRYEEYRGFKISGGPETSGEASLPLELITGKHVRTDPRVKDLFVCDRTGGKVAGPGIEYLGKTTKIRVHRLAPKEIAENRMVNFNGSSWHATDQHGLLIEDGAKGTDPEQIPVDPNSEFGPPALTRRISLPPGRSYASGDGMADVAHELGHGVGLSHHGDGPDFAAEWWWQLEGNGAWQLYEQRIEQSASGAWVAQPKFPATPIQVYWEPISKGESLRPFQQSDGAPDGSLSLGGNSLSKSDRWRLYVGAQGGMWSGDQQCLMRPAEKQAYVSKKEPGRVRYLPDKGQWKMRDRLCESKDGTGVNEKNHSPQSRYGDATTGGNCRGQIVINDKYAGK